MSTDKLRLTETETSLLYEDPSTGMSVKVTKNEDTVDVHQVIPRTATSQTWQSIRDELAGRVAP